MLGLPCYFILEVEFCILFFVKQRGKGRGRGRGREGHANSKENICDINI